MRIPLLVALVAFAVRCTGEAPTRGVEAEPAAKTTAPGPPAAGEGEPEPEPLEPDPITHPCVVEAARFDVALAAADSACSTDADCDCYPGGISAKAGCGGVTSAAAAKQLHAIAQAFHADGCRSSIQCAAWACEPECVDGRCQ